DVAEVSGKSRVPLPPASTIPFIIRPVPSVAGHRSVRPGCGNGRPGPWRPVAARRGGRRPRRRAVTWADRPSPGFRGALLPFQEGVGVLHLVPAEPWRAAVIAEQPPHLLRVGQHRL